LISAAQLAEADSIVLPAQPLDSAACDWLSRRRTDAGVMPLVDATRLT